MTGTNEPTNPQTQTDAASEAIRTLCEIVSELDQAIGSLSERHGAPFTAGAMLFLAQGMMAMAEEHGTAPDAKLCCSLLCRHHGLRDPFPETLARAKALLGGAGQG